jgi:signal recognition particle receptor subunit beta/predicted  nucleic acid-binding Zn-ribbon protein
MVIYNAATRELTAKIVYYGPGLGGKTTNLQVLHDRLEPSTVGKLLNLSTHTDRTIYFDLLPVELGDIKGYRIRFQLATVPGQTAFNETRRVVLKGADGIVFVADSQWTMLPKNLESWQNLKDNLKANGVAFEGMPIVIQYNKRDLNDILSIEAMQEALGLSSFPFVEAVASAGRGVTESFKLISKLTFVDLLRRLQGRRPEEASLPTGKESKDDLQSWRQSLFTKVPTPEPKRPHPLMVVPSPSEEAPFETEEPVADEATRAAEGPFAAAREVKTPPSPSPTAEPLEPLDVVDEVGAEPEEALSEPVTVEETAALAEPPGAEGPVATASETPGQRVEAVLSGEALQRLEARLLEANERLQQNGTDFGRLDAACNALASRLDVLERQASDSGRALTDLRQGLEARLHAIEDRGRSDSREIARIGELSERLDSAAVRLDDHEHRMRTGFERLETQEKRIDAQEKVQEATRKQLEGAEKRQRSLEDDVGMALAAVTERAEKLQQQISAVGGALEALGKTLEEKTHQGRREAEDIRTQLAPVLEAHSQRHANDERMLAEIDRLRESLADSLADLSEHLRRAVRGA